MGQKVIILTTFCRPFVHYAVRMFNKKKGRLKVYWTSIHSKKRKFSCVLFAHPQFLCSLARFDLSNRGVRQPVQPHLLYARLLIFDETLAQPDFAVVNALT